eukprot:6201986-Pleurochrysis_carterae.AAC.2
MAAGAQTSSLREPAAAEPRMSVGGWMSARSNRRPSMKTRDEASKAAEAEQEPTRKYGWGGGLAPSRNKVAEEMPRVETKDGGAASYTKREPSKTTDQHIAEEEEEFETPSWLQRAVDHLAARMLHERHTAAAAESPNKAKTADAVAESTDTSVGGEGKGGVDEEPGEGKGGVDEEPAATDDSAGVASSQPGMATTAHYTVFILACADGLGIGRGESDS